MWFGIICVRPQVYVLMDFFGQYPSMFQAISRYGDVYIVWQRYVVSGFQDVYMVCYSMDMADL